MADLTNAGTEAGAVVDRAGTDTPVVHLSGELDTASAPLVSGVIEAMLAQGPDRIVFDMGELTFMDSSGIALLLGARRTAPVELRHCSPGILRVIEASGLTGVFEIRTTGARSQQRFVGAPASVGEARRFVAHGLVGVAPETLDSVVVMVSELATNAVKHSGTDFDLRFEYDGHVLRVEVADTGPGEPQLRQPTPDESRGRGLQIVRQLSDDWGVRDRPDGEAGKVVWFELSAQSS